MNKEKDSKDYILTMTKKLTNVQEKINKAVDTMITCQNCIHYKICEGLGGSITEWIAQNLDKDNNCTFYETKGDKLVKILLEQYAESLEKRLNELPSVKDFKGEKAYFEQQNLHNIGDAFKVRDEEWRA